MSTKIMRMTALAVVMACGGMANADSFASKKDGNWDNTATWLQNGGAATRKPQSGDTVSVTGGFVVTVAGSEAATTVTIANGSTLVISSGNDLSLAGAGAGATISGLLDVNGGTFTVASSAQATIPSGGVLKLRGSSPSPVLAMTSANDQVVLSGNTSKIVIEADASFTGSGAVVGQDNAAAINIDVASTSPVSLTNQATIMGRLIIQKTNSGSGNATFDNRGVVNANSASASSELMIDSTLNAVGDTLGSSCSTYRWRVTHANSKLRFGFAATSLAGDFDLVAGVLQCDANVTTSGKRHNGSATVTGAGTFTTSGGTCP